MVALVHQDIAYSYKRYTSIIALPNDDDARTLASIESLLVDAAERVPGAPLPRCDRRVQLGAPAAVVADPTDGLLRRRQDPRSRPPDDVRVARQRVAQRAAGGSARCRSPPARRDRGRRRPPPRTAQLRRQRGSGGCGRRHASGRHPGAPRQHRRRAVLQAPRRVTRAGPHQLDGSRERARPRRSHRSRVRSAAAARRSTRRCSADRRQRARHRSLHDRRSRAGGAVAARRDRPSRRRRGRSPPARPSPRVVLDIWAQLSKIAAGLDFWGHWSANVPIWTFDYLQSVALTFCQLAVSAERDAMTFWEKADLGQLDAHASWCRTSRRRRPSARPPNRQVDAAVPWSHRRSSPARRLRSCAPATRRRTPTSTTTSRGTGPCTRPSRRSSRGGSDGNSSRAQPPRRPRSRAARYYALRRARHAQRRRAAGRVPHPARVRGRHR